MKKIAIIGKGICGLFSAYYLLEEEKDLDITFFFLEKPYASFAAEGLFSNKGALLPTEELFSLKHQGIFDLLSFVEELEKKTKRSIPRFKSPLCELFFNKEEMRLARKRVCQGGFWGNSPVSSSEKKNIDFLSKELDKNLLDFSLVFQHGFWVDIRALLSVFEDHLKSLGCVFVAEEVVQVTETKEHVEITFKNQDSRVFEQVILAQGADPSGQRLLDQFFSTKVYSASCGKTLQASISDGVSIPHSDTLWGFDNNKHLILASDKIIYGSTYHGTLADSQANLDFSFEKILNRKFLAFRKNTVEFFGFRLNLKDKKPLLGLLPNHTRVFIFTGLHRSGLSLVVPLAKELVKIFFKKSKNTFNFLNPDRF